MAALSRCCGSNAPSNAPHGRVGSPKKKFELDACVRVLSLIRKAQRPRLPHAVAAPRVDGLRIYTTQPYYRKNPLSLNCMTMATWQSNLTRWKATLARCLSNAW